MENAQESCVSILSAPSEATEGNWANSFCNHACWLGAGKYGGFPSGSWNVYIRANDQLYLDKTTFYRPPGTVAGKYILLVKSAAIDPHGCKKTFPIEHSIGAVGEIQTLDSGRKPVYYVVTPD